MEKLPKGYFGIQRLNGYSHTLEDGAIKELVYAVDMWIEKNTGLIACMTVSSEFYGRLKAAVGYDVFVLDTIIGDFPLFVHIDTKTPIEITAHDEHIHNSESQPILTPKGSPDFSETSYIRDEVKNTCEKITCPVIESVNDQIMKTPLRTAYERIAELEDQLQIAMKSYLSHVDDCFYWTPAGWQEFKDLKAENEKLKAELAVLKRGAQ